MQTCCPTYTHYLRLIFKCICVIHHISVNGVAPHAADFAQLPPTFISGFNLFGASVDTAAGWTRLVPAYAQLPAAFRANVLPMLLASLVHHPAYLRRTLNPKHDLLQACVRCRHKERH
jgi:hypothetical protein